MDRRSQLTLSKASTLTFPTTDFYQFSPSPNSPVKVENCILVQADLLDMDDRCFFLPAQPIPGVSDGGYYELGYPCTVPVIDQYAAERKGCINISQMLRLLSSEGSFIPSLAMAGFPARVDTVLVITPGSANSLAKLKKNQTIAADQVKLLGGPISTPYLGRSLGGKDELPIKRVTFIHAQHWNIFTKTFKQVSEVSVNIIFESGTWNTYGNAKGVWIARWVCLALSLVIWLGSVLFITSVIKGEKSAVVKGDARLAVFILGSLSILLYVGSLPLREATFAHYLLEFLAQFIFYLAFYLLILLWRDLLLDKSAWIDLALLALTYGNALVQLIRLFVTSSWLAIWGNPTLNRFNDVIMPWIWTIAHGLLCITMFASWFYAWRRTKQYQVPLTQREPPTKRKARRTLQFLIIFAWLVLLVDVVAWWLTKPGSLADDNVNAYSIIKSIVMFSSTLRGLLILWVGWIKVPWRWSAPPPPIQDPPPFRTEPEEIKVGPVTQIVLIPPVAQEAEFEDQVLKPNYHLHPALIDTNRLKRRASTLSSNGLSHHPSLRSAQSFPDDLKSVQSLPSSSSHQQSLHHSRKSSSISTIPPSPVNDDPPLLIHQELFGAGPLDVPLDAALDGGAAVSEEGVGEGGGGK